MFTHLFITHDDAETLFIAYGRRPLKEGESGAVTLDTLDEHFAQFSQTYIDRLGAQLELDHTSGHFILKFREYLADLPIELYGLDIDPVRAEIRRLNNAPVKAKAGYYEDEKSGFSATIERVFPQGHGHFPNMSPAYVQNITVSGPTLRLVQEFNTKLSIGSYNRFLVNAFE